MGELDLAAEVARSARDPRTLTRAARAHLARAPAFAFRVALAALDGIDLGAGYEITSADVLEAADVAQQAAEPAGELAAWRAWQAALEGRSAASFVKRILGR